MAPKGAPGGRWCVPGSQSSSGCSLSRFLSLVNEDEEFDSILEFSECSSECKDFLGRLAVDYWITDVPMKNAWITGPVRREIARWLFSDADDETHALRTILEEFVAALGLKILSPKPLGLEQIDRKWMHLGNGVNAGAIGAKILAAPSFQNRLGDNAVN